jgi:hypothetical protein
LPKIDISFEKSCLTMEIDIGDPTSTLQFNYIRNANIQKRMPFKVPL